MGLRGLRLLLPAFGAVAAAVLLASCAVEPESAFPGNPTAGLYARGLHDIAELYVTLQSPRQLAFAGAERLRQIDDGIEIAESPPTEGREQLVLHYQGREIAAPPTPLGDNARDWGGWLATMTAAAQQASPKIAATPAERLDKIVFDGITSRLDRYSRYAPPEIASARQAARDGFGGIGVTFDDGDEFRVAEVQPQSPADLAGIRRDDKITAIDGKPTSGRSPDDIVQDMRGAVASPVTVTVARASFKQPRDFRLARAQVTAPTVTLTDDGKVAILRVGSFNRTTRELLLESLKQAEAKAGGKLDGIILDLRGNPGGLLDQAVRLADLFIAAGPISAAVGRNPASRQYFAAHGDAIAPQTPMAVLINGSSASSAEIVAAALQDAGRAVVIGSSSYGKGTIQTVAHLPNGAELTITWAWLLSPSGYVLQGHGVVPTLCTADLADDDQALQTAVQRVAADRPALATTARASLDETGWTALRRSCPGRPERPALDVKLAERVLADPKLYDASVHAIRAAARLAPATAAVPEASLTAAGAALSSNRSNP